MMILTASCKLLCTCFIASVLISGIKTLPQFSLTPPNGTFCLGRVEFTCTGIEVANGLIWRVNNTDQTPYTFQPLINNDFPQSVNFIPPIPSVQVWVIGASANQDGSIDIMSTLSGNASVLSGSMVQCISAGNTTSNNVQVRVIRAPPSSSTNCSLVHTAGGPEVSIQWSPSFTSQYNVEMYHVVVNPAPPSCPSDQMIRPSEGYSCSGLVLGTHYSFNVRAINCGNQTGAESTIAVQPQTPQTPEIRVLSLYDQNRRLNQLTVQWMQQIQSPSERCSFDQLLNYTVVLEDSTRERVDQRMINSDNCSDNLCSISFPLSSPDQNYSVSVNVAGAFGSTSTSTSLNAFSSSDVSFSSEGCVTSVFCFFPMREGDCSFQYGRDSSYQDLSPSLSTSLNSPLQITVSDADTIHYYQVTINTSSQERGNFTSGEGSWLTPANQGLLVVGVILLSVAIVLGVIITSMVFKKGPWLSLGLSMTGFVVTFVSLVLWVVVGFHVGLQKNTCDPTWQSSRDGLIISAHVFSDISLLIFVAAGIYFAVDYISLPNYKKRSSEQMSLWQKCLHRSLSNTNQYQPREEPWEVNKPKDRKLEELELGKGGRVKELEDLTVGYFRKPGQSYMEAKLETQERYYQEYKDKLPTDGSKGEEPASKGKGEDSHYCPLDHGKGGSGRGHKDKPARESGGRGEEYSALGNSKESGRKPAKPSSAQAHKEKGEHYLPLDHGKGDISKPSGTQKGSGGEYSALGNNKESGRKPAKPSSSQAYKEEGEHYLPLDHGKGDRSGRKDKPSSTQKRSGGEYSALSNSKESGRKPAKPSASQAHKEEGEHYLPLDHGKGDRSGCKDKPSSTKKEEYNANQQMSFWQKILHRSSSKSIQHQPKEEDWKVNKKDKKLEEFECGKGGRVYELEDLTCGEFRKSGQSYMEAKLETQERYYQEYKDELPTDGSKGEEPASKGKGKDSHYRPLDHGKGGGGHGHKDKPARESGGGGEEYSVINSGKESGRKPAKPSLSQARKEEFEHYLPLDHGKGDRSGHKDKPSSTQKGSGGEYSALSNSPFP